MTTRSTQRTDKRLAQAQLADDWKSFMGSPGGRRLMWGWLSEAGIYQQTFTGTRVGDFKEGQRAFGLMLVAQIQAHAPDAWLQMHVEHAAKPRSKPPEPEIEADDD